MNVQLVRHQKGEIEFRKKLYLQQVEGKTLLDDELDSATIEKILRDRMSRTLARITVLRDKGIPISPYLEIGAERCQRSLVMENDLGATGAAVDISYDLLRSCRHYQGVFGKSRAPMRICSDANNLPFMSNSVPFIFCYETLHHFPEPGPVVEEIHRVLLPGGFFFFDEEPYKKILHINLYKGSKIYSQKNLTRSTGRKILDRFFSAPGCNEVEHGVIENHEISVKQWKQALRCFKTKHVDLRPTLHSRLQSELFGPSSYTRYLIVYLLGGTVSGTCQKNADKIHRNLPITSTLVCPSCRKSSAEVALTREDSGFVCQKCSSLYPVVDNVAFLFAHDQLAQLYPDVFRSRVLKRGHTG
jgi:SAM-dependent methyltransferase/uncharacterized protein YbaR (Trm112 family)